VATSGRLQLRASCSGSRLRWRSSLPPAVLSASNRLIFTTHTRTHTHTHTLSLSLLPAGRPSSMSGFRHEVDEKCAPLGYYVPCNSIEDGTGRLSRNDGKGLLLHAVS